MKRNINNYKVNASTLDGLGKESYMERLLDTSNKKIDSNYMGRFFGYGYETTSADNLTFPGNGPVISFGNYNNYCLLQANQTPEGDQLHFLRYFNSQGNGRNVAFQDWVQNNFASTRSIASLVSLEDLEEVLTNEQMKTLEAKVAKRIEKLNKEYMTQLTDNQDINGGGGVCRNLDFHPMRMCLNHSAERRAA